MSEKITVGVGRFVACKEGEDLPGDGAFRVVAVTHGADGYVYHIIFYPTKSDV